MSNQSDHNSQFNFDRVVNRRHTMCVKHDDLMANFGRNDLTPLWVADMDFPAAPCIVDAVRERAGHPVYGYPVTPESFYDSITGWLMRRHGWKVDRSELAYVPGVVRGIALAVMHFTAPGDNVVIQTPVYPPFRRVTEGNGRRVVTNPLKLTSDADGRPRFEMDFDGLEQVIATHHPRMLILCNPHNPGGTQWDATTLRTLASICRRAGMVVISDEIHCDLMNQGKRHQPFMTVSDDAAAISVTFGAPSKTFNIPGLVSSWVAVRNPALRESFFQWLEVNELSVPTFFAVVATEAAYNGAGPWLDAVQNYLSRNISMVVDRLEKELPQVKVMVPDASYLVWIDCRGLGYDEAELTRRLIDEARVALNPGSSFGSEGQCFVRLNTGAPRSVVSDALTRIISALS